MYSMCAPRMETVMHSTAKEALCPKGGLKAASYLWLFSVRVPPRFNKRVEAMDADLAKPLGKRSLVPAQVVCVGVFRGQSGRKFAGGRGGVAEKAVWEYFGLEESAKSKSAFLVLLRLRWP
jgi:hypothetical protein